MGSPTWQEQHEKPLLGTIPVPTNTNVHKAMVDRVQTIKRKCTVSKWSPRRTTA
jgi:hypothetical protein